MYMVEKYVLDMLCIDVYVECNVNMFLIRFRYLDLMVFHGITCCLGKCFDTLYRYMIVFEVFRQ